MCYLFSYLLHIKHQIKLLNFACHENATEEEEEAAGIIDGAERLIANPYSATNTSQRHMSTTSTPTDPFLHLSTALQPKTTLTEQISCFCCCWVSLLVQI